MSARPMPLGLDALETVPVHEQVYRQLTRALMAGRIPPGRKLTSRKVAAELGCSDMPVRAALARLQSLRALEALPNGSMILPRMDRARFADLMAPRAPACPNSPVRRRPCARSACGPAGCARPSARG